MSCLKTAPGTRAAEIASSFNGLVARALRFLTKAVSHWFDQ